MVENLDKYKDDYIREAQEHINSMSQCLLKLEKEPNKLALLNEIFRHTHTLKSMAATMNYDKTTELCHATEDVLSALKKNKLKLTDCIDVLFKAIDLLTCLLKAIQDNKNEPETNLVIAELCEMVNSEKEFMEPPDQTLSKDNADEVTPGIEKVRSINVKIEKLDDLMNLTEELLINKLSFDGIKEKVQNPELTTAVDRLGRLVGEIQYNVMQARLMPIGFVFDRFQRMVRDLAKSQDKKIDLQMEGSDIELDRTIIDEIGESLIHLLRNAVDHGIELPAKRAKIGKPEQAIIKVVATRDRNNAVIKVLDDGQGLELEKIKEKAEGLGLINKNAALAEIMNSIFAGVSTTKQVTEVSGRGFGLNIVKNKIESLGGTIKATTEAQKGTVFILEVPLTMAIIKALFVTVGHMLYAIPLVNIERLVTVNKKDIKGMMNFEAIVLDEEDVPVTRLSSLFGLSSVMSNNQSIIVVNREGERFGIAVDTFSASQEIVIKPLNKLIRENQYFAGSTIIGSGEVVLILDVANLILSCREHMQKGESNETKMS